MADSYYKWLIVPLLGVLSFLAIPVSGKMDGKWVPVSPARHPFYLCVTEINHNATDKTLEITCKIFADDFEKVLSQKNKTTVSISKPKDKTMLDGWISQYVQAHLSIKADGRPAHLQYLGFETEDEDGAVYCYLEVKNIPGLKKMDVVNSMLYDLNNNQINIMHVTVQGERKSLKLDFPKTDAQFIF